MDVLENTSDEAAAPNLFLDSAASDLLELESAALVISSPAFDILEGTMELFISWSGERSKAAAEAMRDWLPLVINSVKPWMSSSDIDKGSRWSGDIAQRLASARFGLICLTPENLHADWILFEAGAISKFLERTFVCPLLFGLTPADLAGPLAQFQAAPATREEIRSLLTTINRALDAESLPEANIDRVFAALWPQLEEQFRNLPLEDATAVGPLRKDREILDEILASVRNISSSLNSPGSVSDESMRAVFGTIMTESRLRGLQPRNIEPIYSKLPPPHGEPHAVIVRMIDGQAYVVRTPWHSGLHSVMASIRADLDRELGLVQDAKESLNFNERMAAREAGKLNEKSNLEGDQGDGLGASPRPTLE